MLDQGFPPLPFIFPSNSLSPLLQIANSKGTSIHIVIFYWQVFIESCRDKVLWKGWFLQIAMWHIQIYVQRKTYYSSLAYKTSLDLMASSSSYKYLFFVLKCGKLCSAIGFWFYTQRAFSDQVTLTICPDKFGLSKIFCHIWLLKDMTPSHHRPPPVDRGAEGTNKQLGSSAIWVASVQRSCQAFHSLVKSYLLYSSK